MRLPNYMVFVGDSGLLSNTGPDRNDGDVFWEADTTAIRSGKTQTTVRKSKTKCCGEHKKKRKTKKETKVESRSRRSDVTETLKKRKQNATGSQKMKEKKKEIKKGLETGV